MGYKIIGEEDIENHKALDNVIQKALVEENKSKGVTINTSTQTVFTFSNENLEEMFRDRDLTGKRVLTVGSSGDQALQAMMHNSKDVTLIDANPLSQPYIELKLSAIKNLTFEEFLDFFSEDNFALNHKYYAKISNDLTPYSRYFWDNIFLNLDDDNIFPIRRYLFQSINSIDDRNALSYCSDKKAFEILKDKLEDCQITFKISEFTDFHKNIEGKYDFILLSNIFDYMPSKQFLIEADYLKRNHLNKKGEVQLYYDFVGFEKTREYYYGQFKDFLKVKKLKYQNVKDIRHQKFYQAFPQLTKKECCVIYL